MKNEFGKTIPLFYNFAELIYFFLWKTNMTAVYWKKIEDKLSMLYPGCKKKELLKQYMCYKLMLLLLGLTVSVILLLLCILEKASENVKNLMLLLLVCMPLLFFVQDEKLDKKKKDKEEQMIRDYPVLLNKLALYIGAGLTLRSAFEKIGNEYVKEKKKEKDCFRYSYEEILYLCRELQGGVGEQKGMEHFGERCGVQCYRRLSMILLQNMKKGCDELTFLLRREAMQAFDTRMYRARKKGEEAETKLLLPMILLMCIVFALLIVPALMSFQI